MAITFSSITEFGSPKAVPMYFLFINTGLKRQRRMDKYYPSSSSDVSTDLSNTSLHQETAFQQAKGWGDDVLPQVSSTRLTAVINLSGKIKRNKENSSPYMITVTIQSIENILVTLDKGQELINLRTREKDNHRVCRFKYILLYLAKYTRQRQLNRCRLAIH